LIKIFPYLVITWSSFRNGHVAVVRALLERGANIEAKEGDGSTPLYVAAQNGHVDVVKLLLKRRANPETSFLVRNNF
jgi:ankyrin repeat protein